MQKKKEMPGNNMMHAGMHAGMLAKEKRSYYNSVLLYYSISSLVFINIINERRKSWKAWKAW